VPAPRRPACLASRHTGSEAIILLLVPHDMLQVPQAPLIATWLFGNRRSSHAIAIYIAICAVVTAVATMVMTDCTGTDHAGDHGLR